MKKSELLSRIEQLEREVAVLHRQVRVLKGYSSWLQDTTLAAKTWLSKRDPKRDKYPTVNDA